MVIDTISCVLIALVHAANIYDGRTARQAFSPLYPIHEGEGWGEGVRR